MKRCLLSALALLAIGMSQVAFAADLVSAPNYQVGEVYLSETEVELEQTLTVMGADNVSSANQFMIMSEMVETATDDGATLKGKFDTFQMQMQANGMSYSFNSENPDATTPPALLQPVHEMLTALVDVEFITTTDSDGHVESMEYVGDPFANLDPSLQSEVDLQRYINEANQIHERLPGPGIEVGQTWERTETMPLGGGQQFTLEREFTYAGPETVDGRALERINVRSTSVEFSITPNPALPVTVDSSDLNIETTGGSLWYDPALGTIVKSTESIHVTGDLDLVIAGMTLPSQLDLTVTTTINFRRQ